MLSGETCSSVRPPSSYPVSGGKESTYSVDLCIGVLREASHPWLLEVQSVLVCRHVQQLIWIMDLNSTAQLRKLEGSEDFGETH